MTEESDNLILRYLRSIDAKVDKITTDLGEVKQLNQRTTRVEDRLDRIERRLRLVEA
jgi:hypothetical protein